MTSKRTHLTSNSFMRNINLIYLVVLVGMLLFGSLILFTTVPWVASMPSSDEI